MHKDLWLIDQVIEEKLTQVLETERDSATSFEALPFHFVEISRLLFDHASDDINDVYMVRSLIEDIKDLNLSAMEVNVIRPFVTGGLETFYKLGNPELIQETERPEHRRTPAADRGPR
nr:hypothetical protein [Tanacetum cinerariifolium]